MNGKIFIENGRIDNSVIGVYVHKISENTTNILKTFFSTEEKINSLINKGSILSLTDFDPNESIIIDDITEKYTSADDARKNSKVNRVYVFSSGVWMLSCNGLPYAPA